MLQFKSPHLVNIDTLLLKSVSFIILEDFSQQIFIEPFFFIIKKTVNETRQQVNGLKSLWVETIR